MSTPQPPRTTSSTETHLQSPRSAGPPAGCPQHNPRLPSHLDAARPPQRRRGGASSGEGPRGSNLQLPQTSLALGSHPTSAPHGWAPATVFALQLYFRPLLLSFLGSLSFQLPFSLADPLQIKPAYTETKSTALPLLPSPPLTPPAPLLSRTPFPKISNPGTSISGRIKMHYHRQLHEDFTLRIRSKTSPTKINCFLIYWMPANTIHGRTRG